MMNSHTFARSLACVLFGGAWFAPPLLQAQTPTPLDEIRFVGDIHQSMPDSAGGTITTDDDGIFVFNTATNSAAVFGFLGDQPQAEIDGYAIESSGSCPATPYFSVDATTSINGLLIVRPADVFRLYAKVLDAKAAGVPDGVNVDAISIDPVTCNLVFSIDIVALLGGVVYKPDDLIRWNGSAFSMYRTLNYGVNIDALHIISDTRFLYSIESDGLVPGLVAQDDDVIESIAGGPGSFEVLAFSPRLYDSSWIAADVVALSAKVGLPLGDQIFADGFEE